MDHLDRAVNSYSALNLLCSPRSGGVSDSLASCFVQGAAQHGFILQSLALRDHRLAPCTACGVCDTSPYTCALDRADDDAADIFDRLMQAPMLFVAAPIHFYALPAYCKILIDRAQRFWMARERQRLSCTLRPAIALLVAGRPRGLRLFDGALLTLDCFCRILGFQLQEYRCFRALDNTTALAARPQVIEAVRSWGAVWGNRWAKNTLSTINSSHK